MVKSLSPSEFARTLKERRGKPTESGKAKKDRKLITVTTHEYLVAAAAAELLAEDETIYQRSGQLVRLTREKTIERSVAAKIEFLPVPILRNRLTQLADWQRTREVEGKEQQTPCHPPDWCIAAVHQRGHWEGVRPLEAVVTCPILRRDGTILDRPGYDPATGVYGDFPGGICDVPARPGPRDAAKAFGVLKDLLCDFPLEGPAHVSAWIAALLTPLARFAFDGPAPMFLIEANTRGAGKKLLADVLSLIVTGERFPVTTYAADDEEMRKRITSLAMAGERMVLFDNVDAKLGNAALDAALTATSWKDRALGGNRVLELPLWMVWYATGNNCQIATDTARRTCLIRIESPEEHPEERTGFQYQNLAQHVLDKRSKYLTAALTILRAYAHAGWPEVNARSWGSFEGWSNVVRSAIIWCGLADPGETRVKASQVADSSTQQNASLLALWEKIDFTREGMTAAELLNQCNPVVESDLADELKALLEEMFRKPDARSLGFRLRSIRRRIFSGRFIDVIKGSHNVNRWAVFPQSAF